MARPNGDRTPADRPVVVAAGVPQVPGALVVADRAASLAQEHGAADGRMHRSGVDVDADAAAIDVEVLENAVAGAGADPEALPGAVTGPDASHGCSHPDPDAG